VSDSQQVRAVCGQFSARDPYFSAYTRVSSAPNSNICAVINPDQEDDQRCRGTVSRR